MADRETMAERRLDSEVPPDVQADWQWQIDHLIRTPAALNRFLGSSVSNAWGGKESGPTRMWVTPYYAGLIRPDDPADPILRQVLPLPEEDCPGPSASLDPLAEETHSPVKGVVHRYPDRALLLVTGFCPTLCRFCLRRRACSPDPAEPGFDLEAALGYLRSRGEIREVILSGGDPLLLSDSRLEEILEGVHRVPHVRMIRIGSRSPATLPMRIDDDLAALLGRFRPLWLITHFNHPREVTGEAGAALRRLQNGGVVVNNQSVLLRGVNDAADLLIDLSERLLEEGVRPYYLHQVDPVKGADHFRVPLEEGIRIVKAMFGRVSGLGIPRYTLDLPGGKGKVPLMPDFTSRKDPDTWTFEAPLGGEAEVSRK